MTPAEASTGLVLLRRRGRDEGGPGFSRLGGELRGLARRCGNLDQVLAGRALDLFSDEAVIALEMLIAMRAGEFEFTHMICSSPHQWQ